MTSLFVFKNQILNLLLNQSNIRNRLYILQKPILYESYNH